ncbi:MAG: PEP-CTERM sorting domain-containing protein [Phycisphaerae bacterium]|nr:PEP-CTERM sorting domain-containing protein [Phycisphaerae bacterium]
MRRISVLSGLVPSVLVLSWYSTAAGATLPLVRTFPTPNQWQNGLTFVGDDLWLWDVGVPNTFYVLDPSDGHVRATYPAPETWGGAGLAYDGQFLWGCAGGTELRLFVKMDPRDGSVIQSYPLPVPEPTGLTFDGTNLWVSQIDGYSIAEVDPETGSVIRTIEKEPYFSFDLAWDERAMWLTAFERGDPYQYYLYRIDPLTGATLAMYDGPSGGPTGIAIKDGLIYVASWWDNQIYVYAVPEPASLALGALGSMLVVRKRRRAACQ